MFQYAFARGYAEKHGLELLTPEWVGEKIFDIAHLRPNSDKFLARRNETNFSPGESEIEFRGYFQNQASLIYTRADAKRWFVLKPKIKAALDRAVPIQGGVVAHRRIGDLIGYGYPVVSKRSYDDFLMRYGAPSCLFLSEETSELMDGFNGELAMLPDFYTMMRAEVLLRANSSFSYWAAVLSDAKVFSPVIEGKEGGMEHHCEFVAGNWPRFANLDFVQDLHLAEK